MENIELHKETNSFKYKALSRKRKKKKKKRHMSKISNALS